ncbi:hypothetical protein PDE_03750 [Penicillium oxalicum 114-2]|uniref:Uncharacterized protein n=1 Tax=Penicillium oxalicum (strain 114-2 / CGMCC 5302) TaxID=933388 RepID=S7ZEV7_PENO1|nr:hypothetical protein PDE_03750 [Penicillium oxalicum 114-2]
MNYFFRGAKHHITSALRSLQEDLANGFVERSRLREASLQNLEQADQIRKLSEENEKYRQAIFRQIPPSDISDRSLADDFAGICAGLTSFFESLPDFNQNTSSWEILYDQMRGNPVSLAFQTTSPRLPPIHFQVELLGHFAPCLLWEKLSKSSGLGLSCDQSLFLENTAFHMEHTQGKGE